MPPVSAAFRYLQLLAFALLVGNTAAGLAGRLAGSLALAAATILSAIAQIASFNGLDVFHNFTFCNQNDVYYIITEQESCQSVSTTATHHFLHQPVC